MASQHATKMTALRLPEELKRETQDVLAARELQLSAFFTACMAEMAADPDGTLERLKAYWPAPRRVGRPPRADADQS